MNKITGNVKWGIIGVGDVCEVKSGPAFQKAENSELIAVMRRNRDKAEDFARRHQVPKFYNDADDIINDPDINALYIATPPAFHEEYAIRCIKAGKPVYIEKPLAMNAMSCEKIMDTAEKYEIRTCGAYYRRRLPLFEKVKEIIESGELGNVRMANIKLFESPETNVIAKTEENWRVNPKLSGGGLFFDLAPHQLDIMCWLFGAPIDYSGMSFNQSKAYEAADMTYVNAIFPREILLSGQWAFNVSKTATKDFCEIVGDKGRVEFSFFSVNDLKVETESQKKVFQFSNPVNIQLPLIENVVQYFRGLSNNPAPINEIMYSMMMMDEGSKMWMDD